MGNILSVLKRSPEEELITTKQMSVDALPTFMSYSIRLNYIIRYIHNVSLSWHPFSLATVTYKHELIIMWPN